MMAPSDSENLMNGLGSFKNPYFVLSHIETFFVSTTQVDNLSMNFYWENTLKNMFAIFGQ